MQTRVPLRWIVLALVLLAVGWGFTPQVARAECGVYHTVSSGQNLFRISLHYGVNLEAVAAANNIADVRRIYVGQRLYIPCGGTSGSGYYPPAAANPGGLTAPTGASVVTNVAITGGVSSTTTTTTTTIIPAPNTQVVNCTGFRATSPVDGFLNGEMTFYWDPPVSGNIGSYQVYVLNENNQLVAGFEAPGGITRTRGNVSFTAIGRGIDFSWYVVALVNGTEACRSQTVRLRREWTDQMGS